MIWPLVYGNNSPYSYIVAIAIPLTVLPLYDLIPLYNELMVTSIPNIVLIALFHDTLIFS